ncbi:MAG TPA: HAD-IIIC family phosphatase [Thermoanaerobaculia bacterium]|nr:HAD-IIIC family phosphatase [Thermoanaerobaculia bacterium]
MQDTQPETPTQVEEAAKPRKPGSVKCLIWDLDNTVWDGILLEDEEVRLRPGVAQVLAGLDARGILHSIASRNDYDLAMAKLTELGLAEYFLYPKVNWGPKSDSVAAIAKDLNLGIDALAFIDDQPFEREEVQFTHPPVLCLDALELDQLLGRPELNPRFITEDSRLRRRMYQADVERNRAEESFSGASEEFLATLGMAFTIASCREEDLKRVEELTVRTHQLNTTGYTYSYEELDAFRQSDRHLLLVCSLTDKYGTYGKIGLSLVEQDSEAWTIKLLLMSCRVMSKGVGTILINHILSLAKAAGVRLRAEFVSNDRNRAMLVTYKFAGFREVERRGEVARLENDLTRIQPPPPYVDLQLAGRAVPPA